MGKHFVLEIGDPLRFPRVGVAIAAEAALDGIYAVRTNLPENELSAQDAVRSYKSLSVVERAFRSFKTVDLHVRPIYHRLPERVRAHVFLCMLAYYVEWHMRRKLAAMLFDDEDRKSAAASRASVVAPAKVSPSAKRKADTLRTPDDLSVHSFQTLLSDLATLTKNRIQPALPSSQPFEMISRPTVLQQKALSLLGITL